MANKIAVHFMGVNPTSTGDLYWLWKKATGIENDVINEMWMTNNIALVIDREIVEGNKIILLTCNECPILHACEFAGDPYNMAGDCLMEK